MINQPFSKREGLQDSTPLVYDDAPDSLRFGIREILMVLGYQEPSEQRRVLCGALRIPPDRSNWSEFPNVDEEVAGLTTVEPWYRFFDALERIPMFLAGKDVEAYYQRMNSLLSDEGVGYRFEAGAIVRLGTDEFHESVAIARTTLHYEKFVEPLRQFERAYEFRNSFPPDWPNAIKEAVNSVEAVLQVIYCRPGVALPTIVSQNFPEELPGGIKRLFHSLYSQGSGTVGARHAAIGGIEPTGPRAELAIHIASALNAFAVAELEI
ncbi:MAG: hypothetical protein F4X27_09460 [Chloroflexi bacterium]|nr:hypothetical protein [Chloroflexota bacterium]